MAIKCKKCNDKGIFYTESVHYYKINVKKTQRVDLGWWNVCECQLHLTKKKRIISRSLTAK